jgi:putative transcriptional regulator
MRAVTRRLRVRAAFGIITGMRPPLAPGLLLAPPDLNDPHFRRAVVLLVQHDAEGRLDLTVRLICEDVGLKWPESPSPQVFYGGPVAPQQGFVLHGRSDRLPEAEPIGDALAFTTARAALEAWTARPEAPWRLILGYAGWGPGQLDAELARGGWVPAPLDPETLFATPAEELWEATFARIGVRDLARLDTSSAHVH